MVLYKEDWPTFLATSLLYFHNIRNVFQNVHADSAKDHGWGHSVLNIKFIHRNNSLCYIFLEVNPMWIYSRLCTDFTIFSLKRLTFYNIANYYCININKIAISYNLVIYYSYGEPVNKQLNQ